MLKQRLIASIFVLDGNAVQSIGFERFLPLGRPEIIAENLNRWGADEILLLDISAPRERREPDKELLARVAAKCLVPLAFGGGISSAETARSLILGGCDKVVINTAALSRPSLITEVSECLGSQCVIGAIDAVLRPDGRHAVAVGAGRRILDRDPAEVARVFEASGAGEILITAIHRDGSKAGYDLPLIEKVARAVNVPIIANSGAGHPRHFHDALALPGVSAAAAGNYFSFTEHSILTTKAALIAEGSDLRCDAHADYRGRDFESGGRLAKLPDGSLSDLLFQHVTDDVI